MTEQTLLATLRSCLLSPLPLPGAGQTALRHKQLFDFGRECLSLARLAEAHWDAVAILVEAGRVPFPGALYGVWASEKPGKALQLRSTLKGLSLSGSKLFCSGAGLLDRALVTVDNELLFDVNLKQQPAAVDYDYSHWKVDAFAETQTAKVSFHDLPVFASDQIGLPGFYLERPGFWHGACGPAACWAGGAAGLVSYALTQSRHDAHTRAHVGAMYASLWALRTYLDAAGREIDEHPDASLQARVRALTLRHLVEQTCTDILRRLPRAFGPSPLAIEEGVSRRYRELDLYLRQSHAERDLESLGNAVVEDSQS